MVLAVAADGSMLKAMIIFKCAEEKLQVKSDKILITCSDNGWMNSEIMKIWITEILKPHVKNRKCLLVMDTFRAHISKLMQATLNSMTNIDIALVPGGLTGILQPLDVSINKPIKDHIRKNWIQWLRAKNNLLLAPTKVGTLIHKDIDVTIPVKESKGNQKKGKSESQTMNEETEDPKLVKLPKTNGKLTVSQGRAHKKNVIVSARLRNKHQTTIGVTLKPKFDSVASWILGALENFMESNGRRVIEKSFSACGIYGPDCLHRRVKILHDINPKNPPVPTATPPKRKS